LPRVLSNASHLRQLCTKAVNSGKKLIQFRIRQFSQTVLETPNFPFLMLDVDKLFERICIRIYRLRAIEEEIDCHFKLYKNEFQFNSNIIPIKSYINAVRITGIPEKYFNYGFGVLVVFDEINNCRNDLWKIFFFVC
jgi:hypothetical protein